MAPVCFSFNNLKIFNFLLRSDKFKIQNSKFKILFLSLQPNNITGVLEHPL